MCSVADGVQFSRAQPVRRYLSVLSLCGLLLSGLAQAYAAPPLEPGWEYRPELLRPFWAGDVIEGESVLFIQEDNTQSPRASVLFPVEEILAVRSSSGDTTYERGRDYDWTPGSREITLPAGSRITSRMPHELRRPAGSQKYKLTHRDGNGEILFGGRLEYAEMQTCITYRHKPESWDGLVPVFDSSSLPRTVSRLTNRERVSITTLGDSISAGSNASGLYESVPYQPAYPELVRRELAHRFGGDVELNNLSVGGTDTAWGLTQIEKVAASAPDLVIIAFGMNDSAGRTPASYQENVRNMIASIRSHHPDCEFILVASMLGNRDWITLKHEVFPQYREALAELVEPGVALADLTSIWSKFLELKKDWDQTGNGVNHPNDFGHRVYAQVIVSLLGPPRSTRPSTRVQDIISAAGGEDKLLKRFRLEERLLITATATPLKAGDLPNRTSTVEVGSNWWIGSKKRDKDKVRVLCWAWSLRLLLDKDTRIEDLAESQVGDIKVFGLRATGSVKAPLDLWFDTETMRLVAIDYTNTRHVFSQWKETNAGHRYPSHVAGYRFIDRDSRKINAAQWYQTDLITLTPLESLPDSLKKSP